MLCEICVESGLDKGPWGNREGGYNGGWVQAMTSAHHAHRDRTYLGHMSANGVLGAGPDSVIVDGDWLAEVEYRANHPLTKFIFRIKDQIEDIQYLTRQRVIGRLLCQIRGHEYAQDNFTKALNLNKPWCAICKKGIVRR